ncbi:MAG TPA: hypothetical protein VHB51_03625 [Candidatus Saccharimonadales bacterium]|nr:hypothetical protein [Candidatus Saccharimonadales bacterium]
MTQHEGFSMAIDSDEQRLGNEAALAEREQFFEAATLAESRVFCGDDRGREHFVHMFGGLLNIVYNHLVMLETIEPESVKESFAQATASMVPVIMTKGGAPKAGVHSDEAAEHGMELRVDVEDGPLGCKYADARAAISSLIATDADKVIGMSSRKRPELFSNPEDVAFAKRLAEAHGRLAEREGFITTGREVALSAVKAGAESSVVPGSHSTDSIGIINLVAGTAPDTGAGMDAGLPFYDEDSWATKQINENLSDLYPFDSRQQEIAETIDTIGTMIALGVDEKDIYVRRPAA